MIFPGAKIDGIMFQSKPADAVDKRKSMSNLRPRSPRAHFLLQTAEVGTMSAFGGFVFVMRER